MMRMADVKRLKKTDKARRGTFGFLGDVLFGRSVRFGQKEKKSDVTFFGKRRRKSFLGRIFGRQAGGAQLGMVSKTLQAIAGTMGTIFRFALGLVGVGGMIVGSVLAIFALLYAGWEPFRVMVNGFFKMLWSFIRLTWAVVKVTVRIILLAVSRLMGAIFGEAEGMRSLGTSMEEIAQRINDIADRLNNLNLGEIIKGQVREMVAAMYDAFPVLTTFLKFLGPAEYDRMVESISAQKTGESKQQRAARLQRHAAKSPFAVAFGGWGGAIARANNPQGGVSIGDVHVDARGGDSKEIAVNVRRVLGEEMRNASEDFDTPEAN